MDKQWNTLKITVLNQTNEVMEMLSYQLFELGAKGVELVQSNEFMNHEEDSFGTLRDDIINNMFDEQIICVYFDDAISKNEIIQTLSLFIFESDFKVEQSVTRNEDWHAQWKKYYKQERISRFLVVNPVWKKYQAKNGEFVVQIDPGLAFGTGNHQTTSMSARALEIVMQGSEKVYDVGTGSGILSFVAGCLGAKSIKGFDLDPQAIETANNNLTFQTEDTLRILRQNEQITFIQNDLLNNVTEPADIIVANILPHILVNMFSDASQLLNINGYLILGGILLEKKSYIKDAMVSYPFENEIEIQQGKWTTLVYRRIED